MTQLICQHKLIATKIQKKHRCQHHENKAHNELYIYKDWCVESMALQLQQEIKPMVNLD